MVDLAVIMKGASLSLSVAKYTGIIQDQLKLKVEQLAGSELEAGLRALQQAAASEREHEFLLREARGRFNKSIGLEKDFRLAAAHLGLALCHAGLGDAINAESALAGLAQVPVPSPPMRLRVSRIAKRASWWEVAALAVLSGPFAGAVIQTKVMSPIKEVYLVEFEEAVAELVRLQQEANTLLEQALRDGSEAVFGLAKRAG